MNLWIKRKSWDPFLQEIRKIAKDNDLSYNLSTVEEDEQTYNDTVQEGQVLPRLISLESER